MYPITYDIYLLLFNATTLVVVIIIIFMLTHTSCCFYMRYLSNVKYKYVVNYT
ncbi:hypothetical protein C2G38_2102432 [Gigaspora rosea]|uniref:Uncharacterized protein n=1 Tax=Gigaspora rosea TaxID=44941 RepID=A0A397UQJ2_9GLOM|nr:hypothetical protein C2G38_2102432 [Gigaspora rosea]